MDNRVFNVNGKGREMLTAVLQLVLWHRDGCYDDGAGHKAVGYRIHPKKGLILTWTIRPEKGDLKFIAPLGPEALAEMIMEWLKSDEAKAIPLEGWDADCDHDGDNSPGWRVYCEDWGHIDHEWVQSAQSPPHSCGTASNSGIGLHKNTPYKYDNNKGYKMSIITRIRKAYHAVGLWFTKKLDDIKWSARMADAMKGVDPADAEFVKTCLTNQMNHMRMAANVGATMFATRAAMNAQHDMLFSIARRVVVKMIDLKQIVGVQPMQGPVGLVFHMRYENIEDEATDSPGKRMRLLVTKEAVEAGSRKLQARWSPESAQDLAAVHGVDFEQELQEALASVIVEEMFSEVINDLCKIASSNANSHVVVNNQDIPERAFASNAELVVSLSKMCNQIAAATRRGAGNFIVTTPMGATLLQAISAGTFVEAAGAKKVGPLYRLGTLNGTITVYASTVLSEDPNVDPFLIGFKGKSDVDTGYVYSPYVPLMANGPVIDPITFIPTMTLMTRYGKKQLPPAPEYQDASPYYGLIKFGPEGTTLVDQPESKE